MSRKLKVGILGGTGLVGQRFVTLLEGPPWFEVVSVAASERSAGKTYAEAVEGRWKIDAPMPERVGKLKVKNVNQTAAISSEVDFVFSAVDMKKNEIKEIEERYAKAETPVISNNSAHRWTDDVPVVIPEINPEHLCIIDAQKKRLGVNNGFIVTKPNCSIQSYVPALHALKQFGVKQVAVCTYQAISGSGKVFRDWPEIIDNVIPYIGGEEDKSENEPLRIWGSIMDGKIVKAKEPVITAQCIRIPVSDGHIAAVFVTFEKKPSKENIIELWRSFEGKPQELDLPSAPKPFIKYFEEDDRPQTKLDRDYGKGMGITIGRLRDDPVYDYKFVCLSHNTIRGAAGGGILTAELLKAEGYLKAK